MAKENTWPATQKFSNAVAINAGDISRFANELYYNGTGNPYILFGTNSTTYGFDNGNANSLSLFPLGKVGIGTSTPPSQFTVSNQPTGLGVVATTTVDFGDYATTTSHACFNTKNTAGVAISFYFNASNAMIIEANRCK